MSNFTVSLQARQLMEAGMALCSFVIVADLVVFVLAVVGLFKIPLRKTAGFVMAGILVSTTCRLAWWVLNYTNTNYPALYVMSRLAFMFWSLTFMVLLFGWIEAVHARYPPPTTRFVPAVGITLLVCASVVVIFTVIVLILAFTIYGTPTAGQAVYDANIIFIAVLQVLLSIGFLVYGVVLLVKLKSTKQQSVRRKATYIRIITVTLVFFFCFSMRAIMFLYRPITQGGLLNLAFFQTFAYLVPDTIPPLVQLFVLASAFAISGKMASSTSTGSATNLVSGATKVDRADDDSYASADEDLEKSREVLQSSMNRLDVPLLDRK